MYMGDDFFTNRDDTTTPEKRDDFADSRRQRSLRKIIMVVLLLAALGAAWHFTGGDIKMVALLTGALAITGFSLAMKLGSMKARAKSMSAGRIVLNIVVAVLILAAVWYFYARGMDSMLEP